MGLMPGHVYRALYPCALHGVSDDEAIASIHRIFKTMPRRKISPPSLLSRCRGEGGFYAASPAFMQRLRALCDEHGIMLIADEVQSGAGRTGTLFAMEQMGVAADITTFAKSIAGGFPLAGVTGRAEVMDAIAPRRTGRHLRRQPHRLRRRPGGITDFRAGESAGKSQPARRHPAPGPAGDR